MIRALAAVLLAVLLLIAGLLGALLWFPGPLVRAGLRAAGIETVAFEGLDLGPTSLEVTDLRLGTPPSDRLERLRIRYRLRDLVRGRVASIEAGGLRLRGRWVDGRLEPAGFEPPAAGAESGLRLPVLPDQVVVRAAEVALETPWGELVLPLSAELRAGWPEAEFSIDMAGGRLLNDAGEVRADLDLRGHLPLDPKVTLGAVRAQGRLAFAAAQMALPDLAGAIDGRGELTFEIADGRIDARLDPAEATIGALAAPLRHLAEALPTPWQVRLGDQTGPIRLTGPLAITAADFRVAGGLVLAAGRARLAADLDGSLGTDAEGKAEAGNVKVALSIGGLGWRELEVASGRLGLQAEGRPEDWRGTADLELAGGGAPKPGVAVTGATLSQKLAVNFADDRLTLSASEPGRLGVESVTWPDGGRAGPLAFRLEPGEPPLLIVDLAAAGPIGWRHALRAKGDPFDLAAGAIRGPARATDLSLAASGDRNGLASAEIKLGDGRLELSQQQIILEGIATEFVLGPDGLPPGESIPIAVANLSHIGNPAWFAPLTLSGTLRPAAERVDLDARISRPADELVLTLRGRHEPGRGRGQAEVKLAPLTFVPGRRQPRQLAPVLGEQLRDVAGRIALDGTLGWGARGQIWADLALLLEGLGFRVGPARFEQVNGVLNINRLSPLTTPPGQELAIGLLNFGLPLTQGLIGFRIDPDQTVAVEQLRWDFAGGTIRARPFRVGSATSDMTMTLTADALDLGQLFGLTRLPGLSGQGRVQGSLPVRIMNGVAVIEAGEFATAGPGWLRYRPTERLTALEAGGANVSLLLQALENFHYEALRITLDGPTDAEMDIKLHVRGANPELYDGHPIEFNLNLRGELANILRSGFATYQLPERIRQQMRSFPR